MDESRIQEKRIAAPRRTHTKSRTGCSQCKGRHVKCDERRPACSLCIKRKLGCAYPRPQSPTSRRESPPMPTANETERVYPAKCDSPHRTRLYEMRLFHHFVIHTGPTLTRNARDKFLWDTVVPQLATSHDYVMDSVLAIAALHFAFTNPEESQFYMGSALDYYNKALTASRENLSSGNSQNPDACAICSICILVATTAYSSMSKEKNQKDPLDDMLQKRMILKGTRFLVRQSEQIPMNPLFKKWKFGDLGNDEQVELFEESNSNLIHLHGEILEKLGEVSSALKYAHPEDREILMATYRLLVEAIGHWPVQSGIMQWSLEISDEYINMLKQGNWLARVILIFYGLGLHLSSKRWIIQDSGKRLVRSILPRKSEVPSQWADLIIWISQALEL